MPKRSIAQRMKRLADSDDDVPIFAQRMKRLDDSDDDSQATRKSGRNDNGTEPIKRKARFNRGAN